MKNLKNNIFRYLFEFLIVAFGVFLGMYASDISNKKTIKENKEKTVNNIIQELKYNQSELENAIQYHQDIKNNLDSLLNTFSKEDFKKKYIESEKFKFWKIKGWTGSGFSELENTSFEVAKTSGVLQHMDIEMIQEISKIYKKIETLSGYQKSLQNRMMSLNSESEVMDAVLDIGIITGDNLYTETQILEKIKNSITKIDSLRHKSSH